MLHCPDTRSHAQNVLQSIVARAIGIVWTIPRGQAAPGSGSETGSETGTGMGTGTGMRSKTLQNRPYATIYHSPLVCMPLDCLYRLVSQYRPITGRVLMVAVPWISGCPKNTPENRTADTGKNELIMRSQYQIIDNEKPLSLIMRIQNQFRELRRGRARVRLRTCRSLK